MHSPKIARYDLLYKEVTVFNFNYFDAREFVLPPFYKHFEQYNLQTIFGVPIYPVFEECSETK